MAATNGSSATRRGRSGLPVLVFDVNETLLDLSSLAQFFGRSFGVPELWRSWFDQVLIHSQALSLAGLYADAGVVGSAVLHMLAQARAVALSRDDVEAMKAALLGLRPHADVPDALVTLSDAGFRMVTRGNSPAAVIDKQLTAADLRRHFDLILSIDERAHRFKPARDAYVDAANELAADPADLWLVSCHAFDTLGAGALGWKTALVCRPGSRGPIALGPDCTRIVDNLAQLADDLVRLHPP